MGGITPLAQVLVIRPAPSVLLAILVTVAHCGALIAIAICGLGAWTRIFLMAVMMGSAALHVWQWRRGRAFRHATTYLLGTNGTWFRRGPDGSSVPLTVVPPTFVNAFLVVVRFRADSPAHAMETLVLPQDSLDADTHRRLRVRLRFPLQR